MDSTAGSNQDEAGIVPDEVAKAQAHILGQIKEIESRMENCIQETANRLLQCLATDVEKIVRRMDTHQKEHAGALTKVQNNVTALSDNQAEIETTLKEWRHFISDSNSWVLKLRRDMSDVQLVQGNILRVLRMNKSFGHKLDVSKPDEDLRLDVGDQEDPEKKVGKCQELLDELEVTPPASLDSCSLSPRSSSMPPMSGLNIGAAPVSEDTRIHHNTAQSTMCRQRSPAHHFHQTPLSCTNISRSSAGLATSIAVRASQSVPPCVHPHLKRAHSGLPALGPSSHYSETSLLLQKALGVSPRGGDGAPLLSTSLLKQTGSCTIPSSTTCTSPIISSPGSRSSIPSPEYWSRKCQSFGTPGTLQEGSQPLKFATPPLSKKDFHNKGSLPQALTPDWIKSITRNSISKR